MKNLIFMLLVFVFSSYSCGPQNNQEQTDTKAETSNNDHATASDDDESVVQASPKRAAMANIGKAHIHIEYSSPKVRGRVIWGELVPYDKVWVTGAHMATSINIPADANIEGNKVPAGKYALFTIPGKVEWSIILNKNYEQHLADDYDESLDVLRIKVTPEKLDESVEDLTYTVKSTGENRGLIAITWEKIRVSFEIEIP